MLGKFLTPNLLILTSVPERLLQCFLDDLIQCLIRHHLALLSFQTVNPFHGFIRAPRKNFPPARSFVFHRRLRFGNSHGLGISRFGKFHFSDDDTIVGINVDEIIVLERGSQWICCRITHGYKRCSSGAGAGGGGGGGGGGTYVSFAD